MNLTEFAERIVFATTLEEKLSAPGRLSFDRDASNVPNVASLRRPSRPVGMEMQLEPASAIQPPSDDRLENDRERGRLLHFLANHELLATELMALVLLKFPDAPAAFRQGVLVTLQEEQAHTKMYLDRMAECGVEFGSYPLSGQFWRVVEPMDSPKDFVARLSLTFEQANLDYSLHFASVFRRIGDMETASVLQQIYEDEIGHVQHGLHWFQQWKDPTKSDWEAYQASLEFPMSPQRGRGPGIAFNREGRQRAGLSDDFIDAIEVFRQSRGRAASLRWFDPGVEAELSGDHLEKQQPMLTQLGEDLEWVQVAVSKPDDILVVRRMPSLTVRKRWIEAGFLLPEFATFEQLPQLHDRKLHDFAPWGWTPNNHQLIEPLLPHVRHQPPSWRPDYQDLYRKSWGTQWLTRWLADVEGDQASQVKGDRYDWLDDVAICGQPVGSLKETAAAVGMLAEQGFASALFKQDLATSGRGQRRIETTGPLTDTDKAWLNYRIQDGSIAGVVEPELERVLDLSFVWKQESGQVEPTFLGWTLPIVSEGRRYSGTRLQSKFQHCPPELRRFLLEKRCLRLKQVTQWLSDRLGRVLNDVGFVGPFGVDTMVYRREGQLKIKPLVELNPRMTMGHIALALQKRLAPGVEAEFRIYSRSEWQALPKVERAIEKNAQGQLIGGQILFGDVDPATKLIPVLQIES